MSKDLNRVQLLGHLGGDPELRYLDTGQALATFSVATSRRWTDAAGQEQEETEWSRIVTWGKLAEICGQYLQRGSRIYLEGRLRTRSWEDVQTTERRSATEVVADELIMLDGRNRTAVERTDDHDAVAGDDAATPASSAIADAPGGRTSGDTRAPPHAGVRVSSRPRVVVSPARVADSNAADGDLHV